MPGSLDRSASFADRWVAAQRRLGHPLCVGLDPNTRTIPPLFGDAASSPEAAAAAAERFCLAGIERLAPRVAAVKPQSAYFECLGWRGLRALERVTRAAREAGLLVILDAKRGDIGATSDAYAETYLERGAPLEADALTLHPYLGLEALEPFVARAETYGRALFVLVRTSNPGARDFQDLESGSEPLFVRVAETLEPLCRRLAATGPWSNLGIVAGATYPEDARRLRRVLPAALFLVPGYGAQGAPAKDALAGFTPGPDGRLEGGLVNASRSILFPKDAAKATDAAGWELAVDAALDAAIRDLGDASRGMGAA
jgi:orotidine-5'-phosphate decarboxylase